MQVSTLSWIALGGLSMTAIALVGAVTLVLPERVFRRWLVPLVAFAAGSLLGGAFLHMIPAAVATYGGHIEMWLWVLAGFVAFFLLERFLHWHHCQRADTSCRQPMTVLILIGDGLHNLIGGLAVVGAFVTDIKLGIAAWLAAAAHEIPQELGDFGVLVHGGWSKKRALLFNVLSASTFAVGGLIAYLASRSLEVAFLLPFAAGNFIYIAASDLVPEVGKHDHDLESALVSTLSMAAGIALLYILRITLDGGAEKDAALGRSASQGLAHQGLEACGHGSVLECLFHRLRRPRAALGAALGLEALAGHAHVARVLVPADPPPTESLGDHGGGSRADEGIDDQAALDAAPGDESTNQLLGLLSRVQRLLVGTIAQHRNFEDVARLGAEWMRGPAVAALASAVLRRHRLDSLRIALGVIVVGHSNVVDVEPELAGLAQVEHGLVGASPVAAEIGLVAVVPDQPPAPAGEAPRAARLDVGEDLGEAADVCRAVIGEDALDLGEPEVAPVEVGVDGLELVPLVLADRIGRIGNDQIDAAIGEGSEQLHRIAQAQLAAIRAPHTRRGGDLGEVPRNPNFALDPRWTLGHGSRHPNPHGETRLLRPCDGGHRRRR